MFPQTVLVKPVRPVIPARQWKPPFCLISTEKSQVCSNFVKAYWIMIVLKDIIASETIEELIDALEKKSLIAISVSVVEKNVDVSRYVVKNFHECRE